MFKRNVLSGLVATATAVGLLFGSLVAQERRGGDERDQVKQAAEVRFDGNEVVVVDADGNEQRIEVGGVASIQLQQRLVAGPDGEQDMQVDGRVVIVDGDGQVHHFRLGEGQFRPDRAWQFLPDGIRPLDLATQRLMEMPGRFMLGVATQAPLSEDEIERLGLEQGVGVRVVTVFDNTPAAEAGIQVDDVLVRVDDQELTSAEELTRAVQQAGRDDRELQFELRRNGETQTVAVKPVRRDRALGAVMMPDGPRQFSFELDREHLDRLRESLQLDPRQMEGVREAMERQRKMIEEAMGQFRSRIGEEEFRFESFGPGAVWRELPPEMREEITQQVQELRQKLDEMRRERQSEMEELRRQLNELRESLRDRQPRI